MSQRWLAKLGNWHQALAINAAALSAGTLTITLLAKDSNAQTSTVSISIQIFRDQPVLPPSLSISSANLNFITIGNGNQPDWKTLSIRNTGDGTLTWSATTNQSWIRFSSVSGTAPTDISIAADPAGLPVGQYTAIITITTPDASNNPRVIEATLIVEQLKQIFLPVISR